MGQVIFFFYNMSRILGPTQSLIQYVQGGVSFPGNKWAGNEGDHSPTYDAEVKNEWNCT